MTKLIQGVVTYTDEANHEAEMLKLGKQRTNKRKNEHVLREEESVTNYGKFLVAQTIKPLSEAIFNFIDESSKLKIGQPPIAYRLLSEVQPEISALITAKTVINTLSQNKPLTAMAIVLGGKIETEIALKNFANLNPELYSVVKADLDKRSWNYSYKRRKLKESAKRDNVEMWEEWTTPEKLHVGLRLIELMIISTGLIEIVLEKVKHKKAKVVRQTAKTKQWIADRNSFNELLNPEYLPTVMPPKSWTSPTGGGYWTEEMPELELVKQKNKNFKKELENFQMPEVYSAVNAMQNTGFNINTEILEVMQTIWDKDLSIGGMPPVDNLPIPNKPLDIDTNETSRKEWKKLAVIAHTENARMFSKRLLYAKILWMADKFKDYASIYFPQQMDFRGRCYAVPAHLNFQSIDGSKALLQFSQGKEITEDNNGLFWLCVHGANVWGQDKISLEERVDWVLENTEMLEANAQDPIANQEWSDADKPFQALAFAKEFSKFRAEGYGFISHLPVAVDGTCNGLQIYSLMLKDKIAGKLVNLTKTSQPQDIYQTVANTVNDKLKELEAINTPYANLWLQYGVKRSTVKRTCMTIVYGSTRYSCTDFVVEDLTKRKDSGENHPFGNDVFKPASFLSGIIWDSIGAKLNSARVGMDFLQKIARVVSKEQLPIHWITPVGFPIYQSYPEMKSKRVKAMLMGQVIKPRINTETDKTDKLRMANGVAPNFVHGLDAAAMLRTVNIAYSKGIRNFCNVHDSYGTTAGDVETLSECLREAFVEIFDDSNVLEEFKEHVAVMLPEELRKELPELPVQGDLDVTSIRESDFFFA